MAAADLLSVRLLGGVSVREHQAPLQAFASPRLAALLAHLVLHRDSPQDRARLAFQLWPDSTETQARTNLRHLLHDLRRALPDADALLEVTNRTVRWRPDAPATVDVCTFEDALTADATEREGSERRRGLETALEHYGGDLLPASWDDWVLVERDRLRGLAVDAARWLLDDDLARGFADEALAHARRLLDLDPLCEPAYAGTMQAHIARGERAAAVRTYHSAVATLERELGVQPGPDLRVAYDAIRSAAATDTRLSPITRTGPEAPATGAPFVGREQELALAAERRAESETGRTQLLLVTGEPGIGKSRLAAEIARHAAAEGARVARSRSYETGDRPAWGPVGDWLRSESVRPAIDRLEPVWRSALSRVFPELRPDADVPVAPLGPGEDRAHLFEALARALLAGEQPLVLVADDLQWCDADTLEFIAFLAESRPDSPLLLVGTLRPEDVDESRQLDALRATLVRSGALTEIGLEPLGERDTTHLVTALAAGTVDPAVAERLFRDTEGNPLFVVETVRAGLPDPNTEPVVPPTVQAVIRSRLDRLSPSTRPVVEVAATIGRTFTAEELAAATELDDDTLVDALDELWRRGIVREHKARYDFSHDKLREVARASISPARRRRYHRSVAVALETLHADHRSAVAGRLAGHYEEAGMTAEAIDASDLAAEYAAHVFALDEAVDRYRRTLLLLEGTAAGSQRDDQELALRTALGTVLVTREGYGSPAVFSNYQRTLALGRRLGRPPSPSVLRGVALHHVTSCQFDRASEVGRQLVTLGDHDHPCLVEGHYVLGVSAFWVADFTGADNHLATAVEAYRPEEGPDHLRRFAQDPKAVCLTRLALNRWFRGDLEAASRTMGVAVRLAVEIDHPMTEAYVRGYDAMHAALDRDDARLGSCVEALTALVQRRRIGFFTEYAEFLAAWRATIRSNGSSIDVMRDVVEYWRREQQLHLTLGLRFIAEAHLLAGEPDAGRRAVHDALSWTEDHGQRYLESEFHRLDGELLALLGDADGADVALRRALRVAEEQNSPMLALRAAVALVRHAPSDDTHTPLRGIRASFPPGATSPDLRDADDLLGLAIS